MSVVKLLANTTLNPDAWNPASQNFGYELRHDTTAADELAEFAGRNCYRSFHRPNPATRENVDYLAHIIDSGHESVLEHASATFYIETSRSVLAELSRHRHLSFSVVSQRYVDASNLGFEMPPVCQGDDYLEDIVWQSFGASLQEYEHLVNKLTANGLGRKQAREAARAVLPNCTSSPMVVTGNHRAWRDVLKKRWHEAADAEIQEVAGKILKELVLIAPNIYQDFPTVPFTY